MPAILFMLGFVMYVVPFFLACLTIVAALLALWAVALPHHILFYLSANDLGEFGAFGRSVVIVCNLLWLLVVIALPLLLLNAFAITLGDAYTMVWTILIVMFAPASVWALAIFVAVVAVFAGAGRLSTRT